MKKISVLGSGIVGQTLADGLLEHGYEVLRASRDPNKLADWKAGAGKKAHTGTFEEAVAYSDVLVLSVKGTAAEAVIEGLGPEALAGKTVIDTTNPIADEAPTHGVLKFFTNLDESLFERLQAAAPKARFVKAFSSVGNALMVDPDFGGQRPTMFICGNDEAAKGTAVEILDQFGWETEDLGRAEAARAIEPMCMLWCIPGLLHNRWNHAFKLLKK